jgi:mono/diheme cytochrome c family protein
MSKNPLVIGAIGFIIILGLGIVFGVIVRPWANANSGPDTKLNLIDEPSPQYDRTPAALVWEKSSTPLWQPSSSSSSEDGFTAYVAYGCALCHGLKAQGSVVAGSLAGLDDDVIRFFVRTGLGEMPSYPEADLPEEALKSIGDWLGSLEETKMPPQVPHTLEGRSDCLLCHDLGGLKPFPEDHAQRTSDICLICHKS